MFIISNKVIPRIVKVIILLNEWKDKLSITYWSLKTQKKLWDIGYILYNKKNWNKRRKWSSMFCLKSKYCISYIINYLSLFSSWSTQCCFSIYFSNTHKRNLNMKKVLSLKIKWKNFTYTFHHKRDSTISEEYNKHPIYTYMLHCLKVCYCYSWACFW